MGAVCCETDDGMYEARSAQNIKILAPVDIELWQKVDDLWSQSGLGPNQGLDMERAVPLVKEINCQLNKQFEPTDDQINDLFNQIDEDGNQSIERVELFNFLKIRNYFDFTKVTCTVPERKRRNTFTLVRERETNETDNIDYSNSLFRNRVQMIRQSLLPFNFDAYAPPPKKRITKENTI